jgi:hypothetical protein
MDRLARLAGGLALVASLAAPGPAGAAGPAAMATDGPCPGASGITVVVDFQQLGPATVVRCVPGPADSGFDVLTQAGIQWQGVTSQPFVCKIEGQPPAAGYARGCTQTPPTAGYWSYWLAPRGQPWCYSAIGAGGRTPIEGTVEGWSWSTGSQEGRTPPRASTPAAVPGGPESIDAGSCPSPPTTEAPPITAPPATEPPGDDRGAPPPTPSTTSTAATGATTPTPSGSSTTGRPTSTTAGGTVRADRADDGGGGSPAGALAAAGGVAALAAGAIVAARRRGADSSSG